MLLMLGDDGREPARKSLLSILLFRGCPFAARSGLLLLLLLCPEGR